MSIHILLVDDSKSALFMLEKVIQLTGIDTGTIKKANNGLEALVILENFPQCNLILTDLNMPQMDGVQLIEKLKSEPKTRDIPVIVITTEGRDDYLHRAIEGGALTSLHKPFRPEQIKDIILQTLGVKEDESKIGHSFTGDF